ncbi:MAG: HugZ family protein [Planctomycetaceae bacterium]
MDSQTLRLLGDLIRGRSVAALATLHDGRPLASLVPYAIHPAADGLRLVTHVSRLSAHTRDMLANPEVCVLVSAPEDPATPPQALPRVSLFARAVFVDRGHADHELLARAYLDRFPQAAGWFDLGDFSIVALEPTGGRFVAGFARALNVTPADLASALGGS